MSLPSPVIRFVPVSGVNASKSEGGVAASRAFACEQAMELSRPAAGPHEWVARVKRSITSCRGVGVNQDAVETRKWSSLARDPGSAKAELGSG
jgi:hypothetical protein